MAKLTDTQRTILTTAAKRSDGSIYPFPERIKGGVATRVVHALLKAGLIAEGPAVEGATTRQVPFTISDAGRAAIDAEAQKPEAPVPAELRKFTVAQIAAAISHVSGEAVTPKTFSYKNQALDRLAVLMREHKLETGQIYAAAGIEALTPDGKGLSGLGARPATKSPKPAVKKPKTKLQIVIELLSRDGGATITQIMKATSWQKHTVRGAISGAIRKKLGLNVISTKLERGELRYRIQDED
jgi:hypothetical protein